MKTLLNALLALCWLCLPAPVSAITLEGEIKNYEVREVLLNILFGRFHMPMDDIIVPVDEHGKFRFELPIDDIRFAELKFGNRGSIQLLLDPEGTHLVLQADINDLTTSLTFSGDAAAANTYLNQRAFPPYYEKLRTLPLEQQSIPEAVDAFAREEEAIELSILEEIREELSLPVYQLLKREIEAYYLTMRIQAGNNIGRRDREAYAAHWLLRNEALGREIDCAKANKFGPNYNHLIHTYYDHLKIKYAITYPQDTAGWQARFGVSSIHEMRSLMAHDKYNIILYVLGKEGCCGPIFEKLLSNRIFRSQMDGEFVNLIRIYEGFREQFPNSIYLPKLEAGMERIYDFEKIRQTKVRDIHFYPEYAMENGILAAIEQDKYRGKVLFIDFWGTWCGPCREEFPHMTKIKHQLKEKEIVYLYFSREVAKHPEENWMNTVKFYALTGDHYLIRKKHVFDFLKDINHPQPGFEFPTYMLVDREGKVVETDAPKPSEKAALLDRIRAVLKGQ